MRLFIVILSVVLLGCSQNQSKEMKLSHGSYFAKNYRHVDTIQFHKLDKNSVISGWSELYWDISKDSIFQRDTRGHMRFFGKNKCTYFISSDTLTLVYSDDFKDQYLILKSSDTLIELVNIPAITRERILSDSQLK